VIHFILVNLIEHRFCGFDAFFKLRILIKYRAIFLLVVNLIVTLVLEVVVLISLRYRILLSWITHSGRSLIVLRIHPKLFEKYFKFKNYKEDIQIFEFSEFGSI
tara:strand:+ start:135 stop:446 length:312 start_codon:yes stop_codon:yes gene_type:complete